MTVTVMEQTERRQAEAISILEATMLKNVSCQTDQLRHL